MRFIETDDGDFINVANIVKICPRDKHDCVVHLTGGDTEIVSDKGSNVAKQLAAVFPAVPGFELLRAWLKKDGTAAFERTPIIGWRSNGYLGVEPVIPNSDIYPMTGSHGIRCPDGQVIDLHDEQFTSEEEWLKDVGQHLADEEKMKA